MSNHNPTELELALGKMDPKILFNATFSRVIRDEDHYSFRWNCNINGADFEFTCGSAHAKVTVKPVVTGHKPERAIYVRGAWKTIEDAVKLAYIVPTPPTLADVLSCIIMDASAEGVSFEEWCADCGYDSDSRKALDTYLACQSNGRKLRKAIGRSVLAELSDKSH